MKLTYLTTKGMSSTYSTNRETSFSKFAGKTVRIRVNILRNSATDCSAWICVAEERKLEERQKKRESLCVGISVASRFYAVVLATGGLLEFILESGVSCSLGQTFVHRFTN